MAGVIIKFSDKVVDSPGIIGDELRKRAERIKQIIQTRYKKIIDESSDEYLEILSTNYKSMFNKAVRDFYHDYSPSLYKRNYSLYDLLQIEYGSDDVGMYMRTWYESDNITTYRKQSEGKDGLFNTVFLEGWHGGAKSGPGHPDIGTPYWRYPKPYYSTWFSKKAERAPVSPYDAFIEEKKKYKASYGSKTFQSIFDRRLAQSRK